MSAELDNAALDGLERALEYTLTLQAPTPKQRQDTERGLFALKLLRRMHAALNPSENELAALNMKAAIVDRAAAATYSGDDVLRDIGVMVFDLLLHEKAWEAGRS